MTDTHADATGHRNAQAIADAMHRTTVASEAELDALDAFAYGLDAAISRRDARGRAARILAPPLDEVEADARRQAIADGKVGYIVGSEPPPNGTGVEILPMVVADLQARAEHGLAKYGTPLRAFDGRTTMVDVYDEILDAAMYVRKELHEQRVPVSQEALDLVREALAHRRSRVCESEAVDEEADRAWCARAMALLAQPPAESVPLPARGDTEIEMLRALRASGDRKLARAERTIAELRNELALARTHVTARLDTAARADGLGHVLDDVQAWQRATFTAPTIGGAMKHLRKESHEVEVAELRLAAARGPHECNEALKALRVEIGDLVYLAGQAAACAGMDAALLAEVMAEKLVENRRRTWKAPDAHGVVEHVRGAP
jgi:hypothetical protein